LPSGRYACFGNSEILAAEGRHRGDRNQGATTSDIMPVNIVNLKGKAPRIVNTVNVGQYVESVAFLSDGNYLAVIPQNGSNIAPSHPFYNDHGLLVVLP
jgi:hypothetical protein